ncbi:MAG: hypothetical protein ACO3JL_12660, partial [Myxococcota bacterium]
MPPAPRRTEEPESRVEHDDERARLSPVPLTPRPEQAYLQGLSSSFSAGAYVVFAGSFVAALLVHVVVAAGAASVAQPKP